MKFQRMSVGLDVHARSVVGCGLDRETGELFERRLTPSREEVRDWIQSLPAPAVVVYEAGPTGFGLARYLIDAGIDCGVPRRRSCSGLREIGSRPTSVMPGT